MPEARPQLVLSCEHGGRRVPPEWAHLFAEQEALLASHRGYDPGALGLARFLARKLRAPLVAATTTRLLVDLNRSLGHRALFGEPARGLSPAERRTLLDRHYRPYRDRVEALVGQAAAAPGGVVHVAVHTFTPVLHGRPRRTDVGLLYDPRRAGERQLCARWKSLLTTGRPPLVVRRNHPYLGRADGVPTWLRRRHPDGAYRGVELEVNQRLARAGGASWQDLRERLATSLAAVLDMHRG